MNTYIDNKITKAAKLFFDIAIFALQIPFAIIAWTIGSLIFVPMMLIYFLEIEYLRVRRKMLRRRLGLYEKR